jgi:hypothetical protein
MSEGLKHDKGKLDWSTLDMAFIEPLVETTSHGVEEYGFMNYLKPFENSDRRFWAAMQRHLKGCQHDSLAKDEKSGCYHLASVAFNALARLYHARKESREDSTIQPLIIKCDVKYGPNVTKHVDFGKCEARLKNGL